METNTTHRFPRPMGLTQLSLEFQKHKTQDAAEKLLNYFINQWFMNNGTICGVSYDTNAFMNRFNIGQQYIDNYMRDQILGSKIWSLDNGENLVQGLMSMQVAWAMEDRMEACQQVNLLKMSQNGKYTPFVSAELNKALKLKLETSTSLQTIIRSLSGGGSYNVFNIQQNNQQNVQQGISVEEARSLIQESQKVIPKTEQAKLLETKYDLGELPEVVAMKQTGVDTSKEGLNLNKVELNQITDDYKGAIEASSKEHHELRREIEMRIDPDEEDPEFDTYEEVEDDLEQPLNFSPYLNH